MTSAQFFNRANWRDPDGLVLVGGELSPPWLLEAYRRGIFPWPITGLPVMAWWSPDPRGIIELDEFHVSRRLAATIRSARFEVTVDTDFAGVIAGCATAQDRSDGTWLSDEMIAAYQELHRLGHAHSVEVWHEGQLAGGTYGLAIGGLFAGESMFYRVRDASKVALAYLVERLRRQQFRLFDIQMVTSHTRSLGAVEIPRSSYLKRLGEALQASVSFSG